MKKGWLKYTILITGFVLLVLLEYFKPKPIDWSVNFENDKTMPYGCQVLYQSLPGLFPSSRVKVNKTNYFQFLRNKKPVDATVVLVTSNLQADAYDTQALLQFIRSGNQAFVCAASFSNTFLDSCNFAISTKVIDSLHIKQKATSLNFVNPAIASAEGYFFPGQLYKRMFTGFDTAKTSVLGFNATNDVNFIKMQLGKGELFVNLQPLAFTNYNILYGSPGYASGAFSYVSRPVIIWDEYYKPARKLSSSPIRYILTQKSLKHVYYLILILLIAYILIEAKRKQRIIPLFQLPENTSLNFVKTIGTLYYQKGNHKDLALKKITYLNEYLQTRFKINLYNFHSANSANSADRSGIAEELLQALAHKIEYINGMKNMTETELKKLNEQIEKIYQQSL